MVSFAIDADFQQGPYKEHLPMDVLEDAYSVLRDAMDP